uniref:Saposin B-type domain-containing protein n=1 Tax=Megaselia scalaris TaxID=36166 RepID=T1GK24_MEGSC
MANPQVTQGFCKMKLQIVFISIFLFLNVKTEDTIGINDIIQGSLFVENFQNIIKKYIGQIQKGGEEGLKAAQQLAKEAKIPCEIIDKVLGKEVIPKLPIANVDIIAEAIQNVCAIVISEGIPNNIDQVQSYLDALKLLL